jgi:hypothetical protein
MVDVSVGRGPRELCSEHMAFRGSNGLGRVILEPLRGSFALVV